MMRFTYEPTPSRFVPGLRPGDIVTASDQSTREALAAHPCFSPVPEAEIPTEPDAGSRSRKDD